MVIPAYNEQDTLEKCVRLVLAEGPTVAEVLVVDNGSTDATAEIARSIATEDARVKAIYEPSPGVIAARSAGFDAANQPIIARVDADTFVKPGWAQAIIDFFDGHGREYAAATGVTGQYDSPFSAVTKRMQSIFMGVRPSKSDRTYKEFHSVFGAQYALTKAAWEQVSPLEVRDRGIYEDVGLSIALKEAGGSIALIFGMKAETSNRRMLSSARSYWEYTRGLPRTFHAYGKNREARMGWATVWVARIFWIVFYLPLRMYSPDTHDWSVRRLFESRDERADPSGATRTL